MKKRLLCILISLLSVLPFALKAQTVALASWDFSGVNSGPATLDAIATGNQLASVPVLTRGPAAASNGVVNNSFRTTGFQNNGIAITNTDYFQFQITPATNTTISLSNIVARFNGTATFFVSPGVESRFAYSKNGVNFILFSAPATLVTATNTPYTFDLATTIPDDLKNVPAGTTITIRYYASGRTSTGGWGFFSNGTAGLTLNGTIATVGSVDTTPPVTSANYPKTTNLTSSSVDLTSNISETGKTYFVMTPASETIPTAAQVKAGNNAGGTAAFKSGSFANTSLTDATVTITGLSAATPYNIYTVSEDAAATPNLQTSVSTLNITTSALVDIIPPVNATGYPKTNAVTMTSFDVLSNLNENGSVFYVLIPAGGTAPTTSAQIKAGLDGANIAAFKSGSTAVVANTDAIQTVTGLVAGSGYRLFVVAQDAAATPNLQSGFTTLNVTTLSPPLPSPVIISQYYEGTSTNKWIELTNLSDQPVNTATPQLKLALYNISGDAGTINITGAPSQLVNLNITIPAHGTVLIGNSGNGTEVPYITPASAAQISNAVINFNGNDGVALLDANNNVIDAFGQGVNAKDISYVRNLDVTAGSATFNVNDWEVVSIQTVQNAIDDDDQVRLGVHFAPNLSPCAAPTVAATALNFSAVTTNSITGTFTVSSDANEYLIVRSLNPTLTAMPVDGTVYNVGTSLGGGVISSRLVTNTYTDKNLASSTQYYYFIFPLNNTSCTGGPIYLTSNVLTATATTQTLSVCNTPGSQPTVFTVTSSNYNFIQGAFTPAATPADEYLVVMSKNAAFAGIPTDKTVYTVGDAIGDGIVIKRGSGNTFLRNGLAQNTTYYFFVYAVNSSCSGGPLYLRTSPLTGSQKTGILDANNLNFYYGNLHSHSSYSDGNKDNLQNKPTEDYAFAKNSMKMDFLGISEHNHTQAGMSLANWQPGIDAAKAATTSAFVALHGMEWGVISGGGHVIVYGIDSLIGWEPGENQIFVPKSTYTGTTGLFRIINRHGLNAIATLAHPNTTDFGNIAANYDLSADSAIVGSALESGPAFSTNTTYSDPASSMSYLSYYNRMLARGYHLGATIDHDNHNLTFGRHTRARLVVLAPALTENDLLDAMKKMRFYASEDSAARVTFTINKLPVGSVFTGTGAPEIAFAMATTNPVTSIKLMSGMPGSGINPTQIASSTTGTLTYTDNALNNLTTGYYYGDILESDGSRIITSPIWYTRDAGYVKAIQHITLPANRTVTFGDPDSDIGASSDNPSTRITYTSSDPTVAIIVDGKIHILHAGVVTITASQASDALFQAASAQQVLTIAAKPITVSAVANKKLTSDPDPAFAYTSTGTLLGTDTFTGALSRAAGETHGTYPITQGTLAITADYKITFQPASFVILARPSASISSDVIVAQNTTPPVVVLTATSGTAPFTFTYHINTGADQTITTSTNAASVTAPTAVVGTYVYSLTRIADVNSAAVQQLSTTVTVKPLPVASITGTTPVCVNGSSQSVTFTGTTGTAPFTFSYTVNGGAVQTIRATTGNTVTLSAPVNSVGVFNYDLTNVADQYGNQAQSGRATLQVNALPVIQISSSKGLTLSKGESLLLTATGGVGSTTYSWTGADILAGQTAVTATVRPRSSGVYTVRATNSSGCSTTEQINITVAEDYKLEASTIVTPNGDGKNDKFIIKNLDYYPNNTLKIFDKAGRVIYTMKSYANDWDGTLNGSPLAEGTYYYILDLGANRGNFKGFINILRD